MQFKWTSYGEPDTDLAFDIRCKVFVVEQGYAKEIEYDDIDKTAKHIVGFVDGVAVCTARIFFEKPYLLHIGRVCVLPQYRGKGFGACLMQQIEVYAKTLPNVTQMELGAQVPKQGFYASLGFVAFGEIFADGGEPHIMMNKNL